MAVYEGARPRTTVLPRRRQPARVRARRRSSPIGLTLAAIIVAFLLGLFYLSQTVHVAATSYEIDAQMSQHDQMSQQLQSLQATIAQLGAEVSISTRAQQGGLVPLGAPIWVTGR